MLERLSISLFSPKQIANFEQDKKFRTILYLLILTILMVLPIGAFTVSNDSLSYDTQLAIRESFRSNSVPFVIENYQLKTSTDNQDLIYEMQYGTFSIVFAVDYQMVESELDYTKIILSKDGAYLVNSNIAYQILEYTKYQELKEYDFSKLGNYYDFDSWNVVFNIVDNKIKEMHPLYSILTIGMSVFSTLGILLLFNLILTFINYLRFKNLITFGLMYKIGIYALTPYAFCVVLYQLFGLRLLYYLSFILAIIYGIVATTEVIKRNVLKRR